MPTAQAVLEAIGDVACAAGLRLEAARSREPLRERVGIVRARGLGAA